LDISVEAEKTLKKLLAGKKKVLTFATLFGRNGGITTGD